MISEIVEKIDSLYPFTNKSLGYVVKKEVNEIFYPFKIVGNEYKQLIDFQKLSDFNYWYLTSDVKVEQLNNLYSIKRMYELTYPMRVFVCRKNICDENLAYNFIKQNDNLTMQARIDLGISDLKINMRSFNLSKDVVLFEEFNTHPKLMDKYSVISIDIDLVLKVDKNCLDSIC